MPGTCHRCCGVTAPRCPNMACPCSTPPTSTIERHWATRSPRTARHWISAAPTRSADCCTSLSPAPRTPWCSQVITGVPRSRNPAGRRIPRRDQGRDRPRRGRRDPCGVVEQWAPTPADGDVNPLRDEVTERSWPAADGSGARSGCTSTAVPNLVAKAMAGGLPMAEATDDARRRRAGPLTSMRYWPSVRRRSRGAATGSAAATLGERVGGHRSRSGSARCERLQRRLPVRPDPHALLGTAFHDWVQRFFHAERLFDLDDLPGAVDGELGRAEAERLAELQAAFAVSPWAARSPVDVEVPFDIMVGGTVVRGRIDAVFADGDGKVTVVDWKTGDPPAHRRRCSTTLFSSPSTAWRGPRRQAYHPNRCARYSTTCAAGKRWNPMPCPAPPSWPSC